VIDVRDDGKVSGELDGHTMGAGRPAGVGRETQRGGGEVIKKRPKDTQKLDREREGRGRETGSRGQGTGFRRQEAF